MLSERIDVIAPHPLARLRFSGCRVPADRRLGASGEGFKIAMRTLDVFRTSVAAAASCEAERALSAFCVTVEVICSIEAAVCCRLLAVCSVRWLRSALPLATSLLAVGYAYKGKK